MACVTDDGDLTQTGLLLLNSVKDQALTVEEIAKETNLPLFKVRSNMRNMMDVGFVTLDEDKYIIDPRALSLLDR